MNPIEALHALQEERGHLSDDRLRALSAQTGIPLYELEGLRSFYPHFRSKPPKRLRVRACRDLVCHMRNSDEALRALREAGAARADAEVEPASCLGRCDRAPACTINDVPLRADEALVHLESGTEPSAPRRPAARAWEVDPHARADDHYGVLREWLTRGPEIPARLEETGLRGLGGAGFPTGRKWQLVADEPATPRTVVCNADESEPGTFKDRVVLAELPHLVVEGMVLASLAIGSNEGWVYVRHEYGPETELLEAELQRARSLGALGDDVFGSGHRFDVKVFVSPGGYVLGEETALLEALEGRRGEPRNKPPFPGVRGLHGKPTLINNVETFAQVPRALRTGRCEDAKLFAVSGDVEQPGVVEAPLGTPLSKLVERCGGIRGGAKLLAFLPGGASTGFLPASSADVAMDGAPLEAAGSALGAAAVVVVAEGADLLALASNLTAFFRNESCGKCVPCRVGTEKAVRLIDSRDPDALARLPELHQTLRDTSICGLGQAALTPMISVLERFPEQLRGSEGRRGNA